MINPWLGALVHALVLLVIMHFFVVRWVTVQSTSMYATLKPGDLLMVWRWPLWTGIDRNDIVVFRDPLRDDLLKSNRPLLVKRIVGVPGDIVMIRKGHLSINGIEEQLPSTGTFSYLVRLKEGRSPDALLKYLGLQRGSVQAGHLFIELPLNPQLAMEIMDHPDVVNVESMSTATGSPRHIFPFNPRFSWNSDEYGPLKIPGQGDTVTITIDNLPLYDRLISKYEGHELSADGDVLLLDGKPLTTYVVERDYYFVLGDARHNSSDSRYWGFLPTDHVVGVGGPVLMSKGAFGSK
ncbi:MAG: signal peptidase I [Flavobacteriales bacterium]|nr:signal peptidase I [Flavobacteriales bacterium]